jgi:hypothetical protein
MKYRMFFWNLSTLLFVATLSFNFASCSKDDNDDGPKMTVKNLTGIDWYDTTIVFKESKDAGSKVIDFNEVGDIEVGKSFSTRKLGRFFYISARNTSGKIFMSDILYSSDNVSVKSSDILIKP